MVTKFKCYDCGIGIYEDVSDDNEGYCDSCYYEHNLSNGYLPFMLKEDI